MRSEDGAVAVLVMVMVALLMLLGAGLGSVGVIESARLRAQSAADAAALAAAPLTFRRFGASSGPEREAARMAERNGARLLECSGCAVDSSWQPRTVEVVVEVLAEVPLIGRRTVTAAAAAEFVPTMLLNPP